MIFKYIIKNHMAFVNFNHSAKFSTALTNSTRSTNTLYFPSDYPTIIKNGKVFGIKSCTGPLSFNASTGILSHSNSGVSAGNYGPSASVSPSHGGTFTIPYISVNATGHITSASNRTITLPDKISIDNHYSPTPTHTIIPTNVTYATFGDSVLIGPLIGTDAKGHITDFEVNCFCCRRRITEQPVLQGFIQGRCINLSCKLFVHFDSSFHQFLNTVSVKG